uniref:Uncharacterized protein n=1 Tax=Ornithorhynchus anatinus TaxID=9258 RepID=A0A6I8NQF1_ORNAN
MLNNYHNTPRSQRGQNLRNQSGQPRIQSVQARRQSGLPWARAHPPATFPLGKRGPPGTGNRLEAAR